MVSDNSDCVTSTYYQPYSWSAKLHYNQRCDHTWSEAFLREAAAAAGCDKAGVTACGRDKAGLCSQACSALAAIAQAKCMGPSTMSDFIDPSFVKTDYECCDSCTLYSKLFTNRCPK